MSAPNTIPCGQLATPALIARVASTMDDNGIAQPSYAAQPGRCRFCGHPLPYAFSATAWIDGEIKRVEWNEGDPIGEKMTVNAAGAMELGAGVAMVYGRDQLQVVRTVSGMRPIGQMIPPILLASNGACEALSSEVFRLASVISRQRGSKRRQEMQTNATAKEMAGKRAVEAAARRLAVGSVPAGDGHF